MPAPLGIRRLGPGDEALVMRAASLFDDPPHPGAVRRFLGDPSSYLLLALLDDQPVGFIRAHDLRQLHTPRPQVLLYEIAVDPEHQRRGIGRALIERLKTICRAAGADEIFVVTNASNHPAMALYRATGGRRPADDDVVFDYPLD